MIPAEGGVLAVDKPVGPTSHDVVAAARRALRTRRIGHTGTLDPFASGLLLLCVGPATRLSSWLTGQAKSYRATACLGTATDTLDPEGEVVASDLNWQRLTAAEVTDGVVSLVGTHEQIPPAFSAKKIGGEAAHRLARRGEAVELAPVPVTVHSARMVAWNPPELVFDVACSSGTFVRALARDLAQSLGTCAHLTALRRTAIGAIAVERAVTPDAIGPDARSAWLTPAEALAAAGMPVITVDADEARRVSLGQALAPRAETDPQTPPQAVALVHDGRLVAVAEADRRAIRPRTVLAAS